MVLASSVFNFLRRRERIWLDDRLTMSDDRYWEDPEQTASVMKRDEDGTLWMHTGDEGIMDDEGYLRSELPQFQYIVYLLILLTLAPSPIPFLFAQS